MDKAEFFLRALDTMTTFFASAWASLVSWPVAFVVVIAAFYSPLKRLIGRIKRGKIAGVEFDAADDLLEADLAASKAEANAVAGTAEAQSAVAGEVTPAGGENPKPPTPDAGTEPWLELQRMTKPGRTKVSYPGKDYLWWIKSINDRAHEAERDEMEQLSALAGVLAVWKQLVEVIDELYAQKNGPELGDVTATAWARVVWLWSYGIVDDAFIEAFARLDRVRSKVLHADADFSSSEAQAFGKTAERLARIIRKLLRTDGPASSSAE